VEQVEPAEPVEALDPQTQVVPAVPAAWPIQVAWVVRLVHRP
jgi:hypothetical protein